MKVTCEPSPPFGDVVRRRRASHETECESELLEGPIRVRLTRVSYWNRILGNEICVCRVTGHVELVDSSDSMNDCADVDIIITSSHFKSIDLRSQNRRKAIKNQINHEFPQEDGQGDRRYHPGYRGLHLRPHGRQGLVSSDSGCNPRIV